MPTGEQASRDWVREATQGTKGLFPLGSKGPLLPGARVLAVHKRALPPTGVLPHPEPQVQASSGGEGEEDAISAPGLPSLAGMLPKLWPKAGRTSCQPDQAPPRAQGVPWPALTCGLSRGGSSSWEAPPMVFQRSLTIFRPDRRRRQATRAAAGVQRRRGGRGLGRGARSARRVRASGPRAGVARASGWARAGVRERACARASVRVRAAAGAREPPAARRSPCALRGLRPPRSPRLFFSFCLGLSLPFTGPQVSL